MHGTIEAPPDSSIPAERLVIDPVCRMTIDSATAAATGIFDGKPVFFCSEVCRRRFLANPAAYAGAVATLAMDHSHQCCSVESRDDRQRARPFAWVAAASAGALASIAALGFYFGALTLVSGWQFSVEQFADWWPYIVALATGFGVQVGLFVYLRRAVNAAASGKILVATGTTSGAAMVACCTHYFVNLFPVLGATGLASFVGAYQIELFWFGIASNLLGIAYIGRRVVSFAKGV